MTIARIVAELRQVVDETYGAFLDGHNGFHLLMEQAEKWEKDGKVVFEEFVKANPQYAGYTLGQQEHSYGRHVPADDPPGYRHMHQVPIPKLVQRNSSDGENVRIIGNACVSMLYQLWDEHFRPQIAHELGVKRNQVKVDIFGDIRWFRHSILHNQAIAVSEVETCKRYNWFKKGDRIHFSRPQFEKLVDDIFHFAANLEQSPRDCVDS